MPGGKETGFAGVACFVRHSLFGSVFQREMLFDRANHQSESSARNGNHFFVDIGAAIHL